AHEQGARCLAGAAIGARRASEVVVRRHDEPGAAGTAIYETGQGSLRAPLLIEVRAPALGPPAPAQHPRAVLQHPPLGGGLPAHFPLRVLARDALARGRVLEEALPVVDDLPDVKLVVEDAVAPLGRAEQR